MRIRKATVQDIPVISELAEKIWWPSYRNIISDEQISFMLKDMYSEESLKEQMDLGTEFILAERENTPVAFAGFSLTEPGIYKLHKLYVLPSEQGSGTGKKLIGYISDLSREQGGKILELNVNRGNPASGFYKKAGFDIYRTVDIAYHNFVLNDYVMRKNL
ncbi:GNAT family N-acetyltransferase [Daejeonella sp.]|uniref:GNAT family N-acetyltransferase n=1 Tax=Daejeonella sp. TaxID=2805397 RepID=UPI002730D8D1|nr:GNAT family N-acetyltransferase [Daejeonella sp.]MDP2412331.1 GNAT family N-acetyltransferase [Daejeonella sp.]